MTKLLRFADLQERRIVTNRVTLSRWQKSLGFPTGRMIGPNTRAWTEDEIDAWLAEQQHPRPKTPRNQSKRGRIAARDSGAEAA